MKNTTYWQINLPSLYAINTFFCWLLLIWMKFEVFTDSTIPHMLQIWVRMYILVFHLKQYSISADTVVFLPLKILLIIVIKNFDLSMIHEYTTLYSRTIWQMKPNSCSLHKALWRQKWILFRIINMCILWKWSQNHKFISYTTSQIFFETENRNLKYEVL